MSPDRDHLLADLDLTNKIRYDVISTLASLGPATFLISAVNAGITYYVLRGSESSLVLITWLFIMLAILLGRFLLVLIFLRTPEEEFAAASWNLFYLLSVYLTGLGWGLLPLTNAFDEVSWAWGFIVFVIAGMAAGGLVTLYVKLAAVIPYLVLILMPLMFALATMEHPAGFAMAVLTGLFLATLVRTSYHLNGLAIRTIRLEAENGELFQFLSKARDQVD